MRQFSWKNTSIKNKIGALLLLLLTFLFLVILYSVYKIQIIQDEMKEVAMLDIPLNQIMQQVEYIELEQHIQIEEAEREALNLEELEPHKAFYVQKQKVKQLLDKAIILLEQNLKEHKVRLSREEHQHILADIQIYTQKINVFETRLKQSYSQQISEQDLAKIEMMATSLEAQENQIIEKLNTITSNDAYYTQKHEDEFLYINLALGISAVLLGIGLGGYLIRLFLVRIQRIQSEITTANQALHLDLPLAETSTQSSATHDELIALEQEVKAVMGRLTKEMHHREEIEQQLVKLVTQDKLTGLYNRHKWDEQLSHHIHLAERGHQFSVLLFDVDYFKNINDKYGHQTGDEVLKILGDILSNRLRKTDMAFRIGGEEFAILLPMQNEEGAVELAEMLRLELAAHQSEGLPGFTVSIGVTTYADRDTEKTLYNRADSALYQAKAQGRNQVVFLRPS